MEKSSPMTKIPNKKSKLIIGAGYIRESTDDQDKGYSPANQERQIKDYADRHGIDVKFWYKDLITGTSVAKRDDFKLMITDAEQSKFQVILVFHTSRFARNVQEARQYKTLLREKLGVDVVSITQNFGDWQNPSAFLNEGVNELFDEHYSRQLSFWVRGGLAEKRLQGYQHGNPPFGYYKKKLGYDKEKNKPIYEKEWQVHLKESKIVKRIYTLYATSKYSYHDLATTLRNEGEKTKKDNPFTYSTIKDILCNKVYLGLVVAPRKKNLPDVKGKHKPILTKKLFDKVQVVKNERNKTIGRPVAQHRFYLLQGLAYCFHCAKYLKGKEDKPRAKLIPKMYCQTRWWTGDKNKRREIYQYGCKIKKEFKGCKQPDVSCKVIDDQVLKIMESITLPEDVIQLTLKKLGNMFDGVKNSPNEQGKIDEMEKKKKKLTFVFTNTDDLTEENYLKQVQQIDKQLAIYNSLGANEKKKGVTKKIAITETEKFLRDFKKFWSSGIGNEERRAWIQMTIKRVWVKDRKVIGIEPHDDFKPLFSSLKKVSGQLPIATPS